MANALIGKKVGETVAVPLPNGISIDVEIINVTK